jgi:hypothetical protein
MQHFSRIGRITRRRKEREPGHYFTVPNMLKRKQSRTSPKEIVKPFQLSGERNFLRSFKIRTVELHFYSFGAFSLDFIAFVAIVVMTASVAGTRKHAIVLSS